MNKVFLFNLKDTSAWAIVVLGLLYILFPSANYSMDTFVFATAAKSGKELFSPHHLLYNPLFYLAGKALHTSAIVPLMCFVNALFATGCLYVVNKLLKGRLKLDIRTNLLILLGSCFGFMRYATEGETYIIPLFFSLWASYMIFCRKKVFLCAFLAATACLFHQIHFFWWLGLLYFSLIAFNPEDRLKNFVLYAMPSFIVPVVYILVFYFTQNDCSNVIELMFHDYVKGTSTTFGLSPYSFLLTPVSFIRTFIQVHGYLYPLLVKYPFLVLAAITSVICFFRGCYILKKVKITKNTNSFEEKFGNAHLWIFILHFCYAFISAGNAEFMVMLPFALCIFVFFRFDFRHLSISYLAASIFIWNIFFALLPLHFLEINSNSVLRRYIKTQPDEIFFIMDPINLKYSLKYELPEKKFHIYSIYADKTKLDSILVRKEYVVSDILSPLLMSRTAIVNKENDLQNTQYEYIPCDTIPYNMGTLVVSKIYKKVRE